MKTGKIRNLRKNHRGGILLPRMDIHAINITCTEHNIMIIMVYLEFIRHQRVPKSVKSINPDVWEV